MILIKYATKSRPKWFQKTIRNIVGTISNTLPFVILVSADIDDPLMNNKRMKDWVAYYPSIKLVFGESVSKVAAINRDIESVKDWTWLINMSDDMMFICKDWDRHIEERVRNVWGDSQDWFAHFNDGYTRDALPTMSIIGRKYYDRDGYIYHPTYKSFSCDAEAMYVAQMRKRYYYFKEVLFLHQHPTNSPQTNDYLYRVNSLHTSHDTKNYWQRMKNYFCEPVTPDIPIPFHMHMVKAKQLG